MPRGLKKKLRRLEHRLSKAKALNWPKKRIHRIEIEVQKVKFQQERKREKIVARRKSRPFRKRHNPKRKELDHATL